MAMRRLNKKLVIILAAVLLLIGAGVGYVVLVSKGDPKEWAAKAQAALDAGELGQARGYYGRAVRASDQALNRSDTSDALDVRLPNKSSAVRCTAGAAKAKRSN